MSPTPQAALPTHQASPQQEHKNIYYKLTAVGAFLSGVAAVLALVPDWSGGGGSNNNNAGPSPAPPTTQAAPPSTPTATAPSSSSGTGCITVAYDDSQNCNLDITIFVGSTYFEMIGTPYQACNLPTGRQKSSIIGSLSCGSGLTFPCIFYEDGFVDIVDGNNYELVFSDNPCSIQLV